MFLTQAMLTFFRRQKEKGAKGVCSSILDVIFWPLVQIRLYTICMADEEGWTRIRAAILPSTQLIAFFYFFGLLQPAPPGEI